MYIDVCEGTMYLCIVQLGDWQIKALLQHVPDRWITNGLRQHRLWKPTAVLVSLPTHEQKTTGQNIVSLMEMRDLFLPPPRFSKT